MNKVNGEVRLPFKVQLLLALLFYVTNNISRENKGESEEMVSSSCTLDENLKGLRF